jgi:hypothetical protein
VSEVTLEVDADDPIDRALIDMDLARHGTERVEHALGVLVAGPMLSLLDVQSAVEARGYEADGAIEVVLDGAPPCRIEVHGGQAKVGPARGGPVVQLDRPTLAAVLYGITRTCAQYGVPPLPYLTDILRKLAAHWPQSRLEDLLPDRWQAPPATE